MKRKTFHIKTVTYTVVDAFFTAGGKQGYIVLVLETDQFEYQKKIRLEVGSFQELTGFILNLDNPKKGLTGSTIRLNEVAKFIG